MNHQSACLINILNAITCNRSNHWAYYRKIAGMIIDHHWTVLELQSFLNRYFANIVLILSMPMKMDFGDDFTEKQWCQDLTLIFHIQLCSLVRKINFAWVNYESCRTTRVIKLFGEYSIRFEFSKQKVISINWIGKNSAFTFLCWTFMAFCAGTFAKFRTFYFSTFPFSSNHKHNQRKSCALNSKGSFYVHASTKLQVCEFS